jgi:hypothetical protein
LKRLGILEEQAKQQRDSIPKEWVERESIYSHSVEIAVIRRDLGSDGTLVVVRAFVPTWRFPNYLGVGGVGHVRAEGFILASDGTSRPAPADLLWEYR